jgi:acid phosphatase family membrane protein YuiD
MSLFSSPYIVVPFVSWFIAQATKFGLKALRGDVNLKYMYKSGDMPSSHTAIVVALLVVLAFIDGIESAEFGIGAVFALIVIYDAFNVRRAVGEQGGVLSRLIEISRTPKQERETIKIREVLGHTPLEVFAGGLLGLVVGVSLLYSYWTPTWQDRIAETTETERLVFYAFFGLSILAGALVRRLTVQRSQSKLPTAKKVNRVVRQAFIIPGVLGLFVAWLQAESIQFFTTKGWIIGLALWIVVTGMAGYVRTIRSAKTALTEEYDHFKVTKRKLRQKRVSKKKRRK